MAPSHSPFSFSSLWPSNIWPQNRQVVPSAQRLDRAIILCAPSVAGSSMSKMTMTMTMTMTQLREGARSKPRGRHETEMMQNITMVRAQDRDL
jgi:hypothetical protein